MKKIKILTIFNIFLLVCFLLTGCKKCNNDVFDSITSGDFIYSTKNCNKGSCRIINLSIEGEKKEILVFPSIIDGYIVDCIGSKHNFKLSEPIVITNAKKIYFPSSYNIYDDVSILYEPNYEDVATVYITSRYSNDYAKTLEYEKRIYNEFCDKDINIFTSGQLYHETLHFNVHEKSQRANVIYYSDGEIYFIDDCDGTIVNVIPPTPYKEGYNFIGWYKEAEGINAWDFDKDIIAKKEYDNEGNYIFSETRIYAKWVKA